MSNPESQVWLITGSTSNFGVALIRALLASNHRVIATARRPSLFPVDFAPSSTFLPFELDVTRPDQIRRAFEAAVEKFGRVDVVVNKSGAAVLGEVEATADEDARALFEAQFWGPANVCREAVRTFREVNPPGAGGCILNITSAAAIVAPPAYGFMSASKAALEALTLSLSRELPKEWNVRALIVEPGGFEQNPDPAHQKFAKRMDAYSTGAAAALRASYANGLPPGIGDVDKMARALIEVVSGGENGTGRVQSGRVVLGSDAWTLVKMVMRRELEEVEGGEERARGTDRDGGDPAVLERMVEGISKLL